MIKIVLISTKSDACGGATNTNYIDNSYEIVILSVLAVFLLIISVLFIAILKKYADKKKRRNCTDKRVESNATDCDDPAAEERMIIEKQFRNAQITGRDKYILSYIKELDLVSLLYWNETKANASSIGEVTGECSYTESNISEIKQRLSNIDGKVIDYSDNKAKFSLLGITDISCKPTEGGNFVVKADITVKKDCRELIGNTVLDGSLSVTVTDSNGCTAGQGFICAEGFDETDIAKVGFPLKDDKSRNHTFVAICRADNTKPDKNSKYKAVIKPHRLWTIEK